MIQLNELNINTYHEYCSFQTKGHAGKIVQKVIEEGLLLWLESSWAQSNQIPIVFLQQ